MSFFVKASIAALKNYPAINAEIQDEEIVYKNYYNISFAVGTEKGLVVPVLKNADEMSFSDIEKEIKKLSDKAKNGSLTIEDLQGGTFTISNGGVYGSMLSTPILTPPESGVLGMHNIVERPIAIDGDVTINDFDAATDRIVLKTEGLPSGYLKGTLLTTDGVDVAPGISNLLIAFGPNASGYQGLLNYYKSSTY